MRHQEQEILQNRLLIAREFSARENGPQNESNEHDDGNKIPPRDNLSTISAWIERSTIFEKCAKPNYKSYGINGRQFTNIYK